MSKKHRILLAEDHTILREGLRALLSADSGFEIVGEAKDGHEAVQCVKSLMPDIVLMDLSMPRMHGLEAIREIRRGWPETKVLVLTVHNNEEYVLATFQAGASGYVLKDATHAELVMGVKAVLGGKPFLSPAISQMVIEGFLEGKRSLEPRSSWDRLTPREREILKLVAEGRKGKEIAGLLCISVKTVEKHRSNLMKKLDLHNISALTAFALEKGLIGYRNSFPPQARKP